MPIVRRDVEFSLADVPRDWVADDPYRTTFVAALSLLFPEGEKFFVDSVKRQQDRVASPRLRDDVRGFIGQEAMHGREHRAFNEVLAGHGFTAARSIDARLRGFLAVVRRVLPPMSQLAATCALEHFTAMLAEQVLGNPGMREMFHPSVQRLWVWHALEESEHKAVAFDVYRVAGGGDLRRVAIMLVATAVFFAAQAAAHARLMHQRGILWKPWTWLRGAAALWVYPGYFTQLVPAYLSYFRPAFHPDDRDIRELLARWREEYPVPAAA